MGESPRQLVIAIVSTVSSILVTLVVGSIPMEYEVALKAPCTDDQMSMLSQGMLIDGKQVEGCEAARMNDNDDK